MRKYNNYVIYSFYLILGLAVLFSAAYGSLTLLIITLPALVFFHYVVRSIDLNKAVSEKNLSVQKSGKTTLKANYYFKFSGKNIFEAFAPLVALNERNTDNRQFSFISNDICSAINFEHQNVAFYTDKKSKYEEILSNEINANSIDIFEHGKETNRKRGKYLATFDSQDFVQDLGRIGKIIEIKMGEIPLDIEYGVPEDWSRLFNSFKYFREYQYFWERETIDGFDEKKREIQQKISLVFSEQYDEEDLIQEIEGFRDNENEKLEQIYLDNKDLFDKFVETNGEGNKQDYEKLQKIISEKGTELSLNKIKCVCTWKWENRQIENLTENLEGSSEAKLMKEFVKEYGEGNKKSRRFLADILDKPIGETERKVKNRFEEKQKDEELKEFKQNMLESGESKDPLEDLATFQWSWDDIDQMDGQEFEYFLAEIFEKLGYETKVTTGSKDQGADLILEKNGKIVVQAKRYSSNVSNSAVQEIVASKEHYNADKAIVVTNSKFTSSAEDLAESNQVELWGKRRLEKEINSIKK